MTESRASNPKQRRRASGFTLIELLVVISIIGLLASVVLASTQAARKKALDAKTISNIHQLSVAVTSYYLDHSDYPPVATVPGNNCNPNNGPDSCQGLDLSGSQLLNTLLSGGYLTAGINPITTTEYGLAWYVHACDTTTTFCSPAGALNNQKYLTDCDSNATADIIFQLNTPSAQFPVWSQFPYLNIVCLEK